jgi:hypothetical protein
VRATIEAGLAGFNWNPEGLINLSTGQLIRFPGNIVGSAWFPCIGILLANIQLFELVRGSLGASRIDTVLKPVDYGRIPGRVEIPRMRM